MRFSDESYNLHFELDQGNVHLSDAELHEMDGDLETLRKLVATAPVSDLKVEMARESQGIRVAMSLRLPSRTLFTAEMQPAVLAAWQRCLRKLVHKVRALKDRLDYHPEISRRVEGTVHQVLPTAEPDAALIESAVDERDFAKFRRALSVYEEPLAARVGRFVQRYRDAEARLGRQFLLSDLVDEVFLNAFEQYSGRPRIPLGHWLESLIVPSLEALLAHPGEEKENLRLVATARDAIDEQENRRAASESLKK